MKSFTTDDGELIPVFVRGSGPPVVLLHQWAADHLAWGDIPQALARDFTVYAWDARGHGRRPRCGHELPTVARMARDLAQLINHFHLVEPAVVGHSMGALTLWQFIAERGTASLGGLCFIDQSPCLVTGPDWPFGIYGDFSSARNAAFLADLQADFAETVLRLVADGLNLRARLQYEKNSRGIQHLRVKLSRLDTAWVTATWRSLAEADYRPVLARIDRPTLLIYGAESNYYGAETAAWVHRAIAGSVLHLYEGADHSPHLARRDRFLRDLREFLARSRA
ncbi:MAG: alpha/beta fold hydrolase [Azospirillum sp.]|nr:alpha/beta fold hydrolase [Azospirillum sp.]